MASTVKFTTDYAYNDPISGKRRIEVPSTVQDRLAAAIPPNNLEVEQLVLGALLLEKDAFPKVSEVLTPSCFYDTKHRYIFEAILNLEMDEKPIDAQTVVEQLKLDGNFNAVGGIEYIATLTALVNTTAHLEFHARLLFDKKIQRELISFGNNVISDAFDETQSITETMEAAEDRLFEITQGADKDDVQHIGDLMGDALDAIKRASEREEGISGTHTGFRDIDELTSGWHPANLVVIAARPGMGKTAFVLSMAHQMAVNYQIPVGIFSLEMSKDELTTRLIVNHCRVKNDAIKRGQISSAEMDRIFSENKTLAESPLFIDDNAGLTVFDLRSKARRLVREHGVKVIIIDYLQLMTAPGGNATTNREQEVSMISRSMKQLAKDLGITVIALSQLNRDVEKRPMNGKRPQLSDLRESGAIEQDADMVCFIHRPEYYDIIEDEEGRDMRGVAEFIIAKHRNGKQGTVYLRFEGDYIRFSDYNEGGDYPDTGSTMTFSSRLNDADNPFAPTSVGGGVGDPILDSEGTGDAFTI